MALRKLVAGNWKMNGSLAALAELEAIQAAATANHTVDVAICPPFTLIAPAVQKQPGLAIGAQDCHQSVKGAHTGCVSAEMLKEAGAKLVIVGHSERRTDQGESDALVKAKAEAALGIGLVAIVCVGETEAERDAGRAVSVVESQLDGSAPVAGTAATLVIAYEPVWAIGTGLTATPEQAQAVHAFIRGEVAARDAKIAGSLPILYGGSCKPDNAAALFAQPDVDGGLIGGAALVAADFLAIATAAAP